MVFPDFVQPYTSQVYRYEQHFPNNMWYRKKVGPGPFSIEKKWFVWLCLLSPQDRQVMSWFGFMFLNECTNFWPTVCGYWLLSWTQFQYLFMFSHEAPLSFGGQGTKLLGSRRNSRIDPYRWFSCWSQLPELHRVHLCGLPDVISVLPPRTGFFWGVVDLFVLVWFFVCLFVYLCYSRSFF